MSALRFEVRARSSRTRARLGRVTTPHGWFDTPAFMPVGTQGTVKGLLPGMVRQTGAQIILGNTYHLMLRPGAELVAQMGGLHGLTGWRGPILTDSGGYQAYSMADLNRVDDDGVVFRSVVDGSTVHLSPERATRVQNLLGADIIMAFDDCPPSADPGVTSPNQTRLRLAAARDSRGRGGYDHAKRLTDANERTIRWLERCVRSHERSGDQALFGIVQGGTDLDARSWCAERVTGFDLPGYAIGGVAVGESPDEIARVTQHTAALLPEDRPRYLMGVGYERDLLSAVRGGVDMFDCVLPTRNGRNAFAFTSRGAIRLRNAQYATDGRVLEDGCDCPACLPGRYDWALALGEGSPGVHAEGGGFGRSYLRHLFQAREMLGPILVSLHNLRHFQRFMADLRQTIETDAWEALESRWPVVSGA